MVRYKGLINEPEKKKQTAITSETTMFGVGAIYVIPLHPARHRESMLIKSRL